MQQCHRWRNLVFVPYYSIQIIENSMLQDSIHAGMFLFANADVALSSGRLFTDWPCVS